MSLLTNEQYVPADEDCEMRLKACEDCSKLALSWEFVCFFVIHSCWNSQSILKLLMGSSFWLSTNYLSWLSSKNPKYLLLFCVFFSFFRLFVGQTGSLKTASWGILSFSRLIMHWLIRKVISRLIDDENNDADLILVNTQYCITGVILTWPNNKQIKPLQMNFFFKFVDRFCIDLQSQIQSLYYIIYIDDIFYGKKGERL